MGRATSRTSCRSATARYAAAAAVFVHRAAPDRIAPVEAISRHFSLTPAELRVLIAIVEVGGVPEVASVLGVSETTVRTHLRHLFEKTQTTRQADLVRLVAGYANPLVK
jgi:DNA-binding CsgD family transcriptional regulator